MMRTTSVRLQPKAAHNLVIEEALHLAQSCGSFDPLKGSIPHELFRKSIMTREVYAKKKGNIPNLCDQPIHPFVSMGELEVGHGIVRVGGGMEARMLRLLYDLKKG